MESLLKWAILNGATAGEDAPAGAPGEPPKKLDPEVIDAILGKPASVQMTECMDAVEHPETPLEAQEIALDDLEMLVENIDNACNIEPLNLWPRIIALYTHSEPGVRSGALWVSGTAVQHNPKAQSAFASHRGLHSALRVLEGDSVIGVRTKALYCVSSFIRGNVKGLTEFIASNGLPTLLMALEECRGAAATAFRQKSFFLLRSLIEEAMDTATPEDLRPGMYLPNAIAELGFVDTAASVMAQLAKDDPDGAAAAFEQVVGFLVVLGTTENGKRAINACKELASATSEAKSCFGQEFTKDLDQILVK
ncbi:armadillo-type protein [Coemansia spiralis]|nr:armadillo-type protein [Coemansia spiralis]